MKGIINNTISGDGFAVAIDLGVESRKWGGLQVTRCLSIIGELAGTETVSIEIPAVDDPDETVDTDWNPLVQYDALNASDLPVVFVADGENAKTIPAYLLIRVVKTATASNVGVRLT